jgi:phosphatidylserine decarboxylase
MISRRSWAVARQYAMPPLLVGCGLAVARQRGVLLAFGAAGAVMTFFRDPERPLEPDRNIAYAAADGIVTYVGKAAAPWLECGEATLISTFLSIHNVHVTRSPLDGRIVCLQPEEGRLLPALSPKVGDANRQLRLGIEGPAGIAGVVLVAGAIARRITPWVKPDDTVTAGDRLGLIHFGSRVDVLLPGTSSEPLVRRGHRVIGARNPIARLSERASEGERRW